MRIDFTKMHGLGNDFIVFDLPAGASLPTEEQWRKLSNRHTGIGCDQIVLIGPSRTGIADLGLTFLNSDGSESGACGNGTRCVADFLMEERGADHLALETTAGVLDCARGRDGRVTVSYDDAMTITRVACG